MGLREHKKQQTRSRLSETAWRLAADRGFEAVTVAEIARESEVSEATLFNYFRTKEDLFYAPLEVFGAQIIDAVRSREAGCSPLAAVCDFLLQSEGLLSQLESGDEEAGHTLRTNLRVINESPTLLAREQRAFAAYTEDLAALLSEEDGDRDPVTATVVAHALIGVHRSLIRHVRQRVLSGAPLQQLAGEVRRQGERAFSLLEAGLGRYGVADPEH